MKTKTLLIGLGAALPLLAAAQYRYGEDYRDGYRSDQGGIVRCESKNGRSSSCAVNTRGGVRLVRQLSGSACVRGRSWGTDERGIWVSDGCRAEFAVTGDNGRYGRRGNRGDTIGYGGGVQVLRCESNDKRSHQCAADVRRGVSLQRQLSGSPCIEGRTWGWNRGGVWVDQGCRAEFAIR
ncbi:MAG: DUF3011 domain-containing protein [Luteimonas sp.]